MGGLINCQHCQDAPFKAICPTKAIDRDEALNRVMIDYEKCIGCRMCTIACPFGAMAFDEAIKTVIKCDLCDGDPLCAKLCSYEVLKYTDVREQQTTKISKTAKNIRENLLETKRSNQRELLSKAGN